MAPKSLALLLAASAGLLREAQALVDIAKPQLDLNGCETQCQRFGKSQLAKQLTAFAKQFEEAPGPTECVEVCKSAFKQPSASGASTNIGADAATKPTQTFASAQAMAPAGALLSHAHNKACSGSS